MGRRGTRSVSESHFDGILRPGRATSVRRRYHGRLGSLKGLFVLFQRSKPGLQLISAFLKTLDIRSRPSPLRDPVHLPPANLLKDGVRLSHVLRGSWGLT